MKRPVIGITSFAGGERKYGTNAAYIHSVFNAGGLPLQLPSVNTECAEEIISSLDGLLVPGGIDVAPSFYGEEPVREVTLFRSEDDLFEMELIKAAVKLGKPVLGICRGIQIINVTFGGSLYQDIPTQFTTKLSHRQSSDIRSEPSHKVFLEEGSDLAKIFGDKEIMVNSFHHQAVKEVAFGFTVTGRASDEIVEAIESDDGLVIAVQWHPEEMTERFAQSRALFEDFVKRCSEV